MDAGYSIRLFARPAKLLQPLFPLVVLLAVGLSILTREMIPLVSTIVASVILVPTGALILVLLSRLVYGVILRRPILEVTTEGWLYCYPSLWGSQFVEWRNVASIGCYSRQTKQGPVTYYFLVQVKDQSKLEHHWRRMLKARLFPWLWNAAISVLLSDVFQRPGSKECADTLSSISLACEREIKMYGIQVEHLLENA